MTELVEPSEGEFHEEVVFKVGIIERAKELYSTYDHNLYNPGKLEG